MAYTVRNFKTKKQLKEALANGEEVEVYQPGPFGPEVRGRAQDCPDCHGDGEQRVGRGETYGSPCRRCAGRGKLFFVTIEGPHYPQAHSWYAEVQVKDGVIVPGSKVR